MIINSCEATSDLRGAALASDEYREARRWVFNKEKHRKPTVSMDNTEDSFVEEMFCLKLQIPGLLATPFV